MAKNILLSAIQEPFQGTVNREGISVAASTVNAVLYYGGDAILTVNHATFTRPDRDKLSVTIPGLKSAIEEVFEQEGEDRLNFSIVYTITTYYDTKENTEELSVYKQTEEDKGYFFLPSLADPLPLPEKCELRYGTELLSTLYSDGQNTYGVRSVIKYHMLSNNLITGIYYICHYYPDGILRQRDTYHIIYSDSFEKDDPNVTHSKRLFNSSNVAVVPAGEAIYVSYQFPNPTVSKPKNCKLKFTYLVNDDIVTSTSSFNVPQGYHYFSINWANRLPTGLPFDKVIKIEVTTSVDDSQVFTIYPMRDKTYRKFTFVNRYNTQEIVYIPCAISSEQSTESEDAIVNDERIQYDKETFIDYTIKASAIYPQLIPVLRAMCKSSRILCGDSDIPVIITKYKLPKSEEQGADTSIEIGFRCAKIGADLLL